MDIELQKTKKMIRKNIGGIDEVSNGKEEVSSPKTRGAGFAWLLVFVLTVALAFLGFLYYREHTKTSDDAAKQEKLAQSTLSSLSKHIVLPDGKPEVVFPITDVENLEKSQPFFAGAKNGDVLVVYANPPQAIIYDPARDLIVKVGPVTFEQPKTETPAPKSTTTKK